MVSRLNNVFGDQVEFDDNTVQWKGVNDATDNDQLPRRQGENLDDNPGRIGPAVRDIFSEIRSRDTGDPISPTDSLAAGASISAVADGRKPLYHEQWGQAVSSDLARRLWGTLPEGVTTTLEDGHLYIYRAESVQAIISASLDAYPGRTLFDKIRRASLSSQNGILLGYGAMSMDAPNTVLVKILDSDGNEVFGFYSLSANAEQIAGERAKDFIDAYGQPYFWRIER